jgi:hypothetical protein
MFELRKLGRQSTVFINPEGISGSDAWREVYKEGGSLHPKSRLKVATPEELIEGTDDFTGRFSSPSNRQVATVSVPRALKAQATRVLVSDGMVPAGQEFRNALSTHIEGLVRKAAIDGAVKAGKGVKADANNAVLESDWISINFE